MRISVRCSEKTFNLMKGMADELSLSDGEIIEFALRFMKENKSSQTDISFNK